MEGAALQRHRDRANTCTAAALPIRKSGVAILAHVARHFARTGLPAGTLHVLFDADEHTGRFGGVRAYLEAIPRLPDAVSLGYPGNDCIVAGSRGFLRARLHFAGKAAALGRDRAQRHQCARQGCGLCPEGRARR